MDFTSLPPEYQAVLQEVEEERGYKVKPLQALGGGRTGALLYLVSATQKKTATVQHYILKLDRVRPDRRSEEIKRHQHAQEHAPEIFRRKHMAQLAFTIEQETVVALFYTIAGQSLLHYQPMFAHNRQSQLKALFRSVHKMILTRWNQSAVFQTGLHPQELLEKWLGYRILPRGNIIPFFEESLALPHRIGSLVIEGQTYPNPLAFCLDSTLWGKARHLDAIHGFQHGDLNVANVLAHFGQRDHHPLGMVVIDFALYKSDMPLFYDLAYLEMSYLLEALNRSDTQSWWQLVRTFSETDMPDPRAAAVELTGPVAVINAGRSVFNRWIEQRHPSLHDDLWAQYWLAAVASGLNFTNKPGISFQERLAGLMYASAHLQRYCSQFNIPLAKGIAPIILNTTRSAPDIIVPHITPLRNQLPQLMGEFVGRERELADLRGILFRPEVRLVTMTGPGGTGKTRLALRVAEELQPNFSHGAVFVSLSEIHNPELLINRIAEQFGLREGGGLSLRGILLNFLRERKLLLVLDNFEQIVAAAPLLSELLETASGIKILVTSRTRLNLRGEYAYDVPSLRVPSADVIDDPTIALRSEAVQLFVARAQAANRHFALDSSNTRPVVEICRKLDGLPLAIELAAARTRMLSPQTLLVRLDHRLNLLTGGARDLPDRQRTLRSAIDWSYDLLEPEQKLLFTRLGVFVGGFCLEAAEAIYNPAEGFDVLGGIEALINNSLVRPDETSSGLRFNMLETVREYARERLEASGEMDQIRQRHADYYSKILTYLAEFNVNFSNEMERWLDWIELEHENLRFVMEWAQRFPENLESVLMMFTGMGWYWYRRGHLREGRDWSDWALSTPAGKNDAYLKGNLLLINSIMAIHQGDLEIAENQIEDQLNLGYAIEDDALVGIGLTIKGMVLTQRGKHETAYAILELARKVSADIQMDWWMVDALLTQVTAALGMGKIDEALNLAKAADKVSRRIKSDWMSAYVLNLYGEVQRMQGDFVSASASYRTGETLLRKQGDQGGELPRIIHSQGYTALHLGNLQEAENKFLESLEIYRKIGSQRGIAECLAGLGIVSANRDEMNLGTTLLSAASAIMKQFGGQWWPTDKMEVEAALEMLRAEMSTTDFQSSWDQGQAISLDEAIVLSASKQIA